jgi:hypothetical protein
MTYLPNDVFKHILAYCGETLEQRLSRIEEKQKLKKKKLVYSIQLLKEIKTSIINVENTDYTFNDAKIMTIRILEGLFWEQFIDEPENVIDSIYSIDIMDWFEYEYE